MRFLLPFIFLLLASPVFAENDRLETIDTRSGVTVSFYRMKREGAAASIILLTGGAGNIGMKQGIPTSKNFLVRSRDYFAANGFNVVIVDKPSDRVDLDGAFRISPEHVEDLRRVIAQVKKETNVPVWVVGTSMGTISAAALARSVSGDELAGIVLTSSVTSIKKTGAVPWQDLEDIRIPVLVVHHEADMCTVCNPWDVPMIIRKLKNAPVKKELYVRGGMNPSGNPCEALHFHGYIGMEKEVVGLISDWIKHPAP